MDRNRASVNRMQVRSCPKQSPGTAMLPDLNFQPRTHPHTHVALYGYGRGLAPLTPGFTLNSQLLSYECHGTDPRVPAAPALSLQDPVHVGSLEQGERRCRSPGDLLPPLCPLRAVSTTENPASQNPPPQDSPESRQLLTGPAMAGPGRGTSEGPSASDSVVREPTSETSPSSPSVLCRRGLRCQFWMAWRRSPELRGGWARSEPPLAAWTRVPKPPGPLSSGAPSSGRGSSRLSLS